MTISRWTKIFSVFQGFSFLFLAAAFGAEPIRLSLEKNFTTPDLYPCVLTRQGKSNDPFLKLHELWLWVTLSHATTSATHFSSGCNPHH